MNFNPKQAAQLMKKMGIQQTEIEAEEVIIKTADKDIIIKNPNVSKISMSGQETFQISGVVEEHEAKSEISEEDINTVAEQAGVPEDEAKAALEKSEGDLAEAIMELKK